MGVPISQLRKLRLRELTYLPETPPPHRQPRPALSVDAGAPAPPPAVNRRGVWLPGRQAQSQPRPALPGPLEPFTALPTQAGTGGERKSRWMAGGGGAPPPRSCTHTSHRITRKLTIAPAPGLTSAWRVLVLHFIPGPHPAWPTTPGHCCPGRARAQGAEGGSADR